MFARQNWRGCDPRARRPTLRVRRRNACEPDMKPTIRPAVPADAPALAEHNVAAALETENLVLDPATALAGVERVFRQPEFGRYFVAEIEGRIVAGLMITYEWRDWHNRVSWWIQSVYTRPEFRRRGIYAALYRYVAELAHQAGVHSLRLYAEKDNRAAHAVYQNLGMKLGEYILFEQKL
ncbi:MAG: GNAT family N-acetyltransferase [Bacteroidia bacterium]|nr:GNAT family N-acetyltransferase [Bacteroidia bacterium]